MRVYELAKQLGMESRLLIPELVRLGIEVTSHSNTLDDETARRIMEALQGKDDHGGSLKSLKVKRGDSDKVVAQTKRGAPRGFTNRQGVKGGRGSTSDFPFQVVWLTHSLAFDIRPHLLSRCFRLR